MSIDVAIKQKGFFKKALPLSVILGNELQYGSYEGMSLRPNKMGEGEFIAYYPEKLGRGFSVIWSEGEKETVVLRSLTPTCPEELSAFYRTVERITSYWKCELEVDGTMQKPKQFLAGLQDMIRFNGDVLTKIAEQIVSGESGSMTLQSAMWPLTIGREEAEVFLRDKDEFYHWMHEKQSVDVYFANPHFFRTEQGIVGRFALTENTPSIFPAEPYVPYGIVDPETDKALKCDDYAVLLCSTTKNAALGEVDYKTFKSRLPVEKYERYDGVNLLISGLSLEELEEMLKD